MPKPQDESGLKQIAFAIKCVAHQLGRTRQTELVLYRLEAKLDELLSRGGGTPEDTAKLDALGKRIDAQTTKIKTATDAAGTP